jgi:hypothetical protein
MAFGLGKRARVGRPLAGWASGREGGGYRYYPVHAARRWLTSAGLELIEQADTDSYWHLLLTRR